MLSCKSCRLRFIFMKADTFIPDFEPGMAPPVSSIDVVEWLASSSQKQLR